MWKYRTPETALDWLEEARWAQLCYDEEGCKRALVNVAILIEEEYGEYTPRKKSNASSTETFDYE